MLEPFGSVTVTPGSGFLATFAPPAPSRGRRGSEILQKQGNGEKRTGPTGRGAAVATGTGPPGVPGAHVWHPPRPRCPHVRTSHGWHEARRNRALFGGVPGAPQEPGGATGTWQRPPSCRTPGGSPRPVPPAHVPRFPPEPPGPVRPRWRWGGLRGCPSTIPGPIPNPPPAGFGSGPRRTGMGGGQPGPGSGIRTVQRPQAPSGTTGGASTRPHSPPQTPKTGGDGGGRGSPPGAGTPGSSSR